MRDERASFRLGVERNGSARARKAYDDSGTRTQTQIQQTAKTKRACMSGASTRVCFFFRESGLPRATALCFCLPLFTVLCRSCAL